MLTPALSATRFVLALSYPSFDKNVSGGVEDGAHRRLAGRLDRLVPRGNRGLLAPHGARRRTRVVNVSLDALSALPEGTLGRAFAVHMRDAGLDPAALPALPSPDRLSYLSAHLYETHDIWHVVTGFGTDVAGELGLQAFYLAQFPALLASAILAAGLLNTTLFTPEERERRMDATTHGWRLGRAAKPFFGVRWADRLSTPLVDVRRELGVPDGGVRALAS